MSKISQFFQKHIHHTAQPSIYHYISPPEDPRNYRLHLRLESDGSGLLIMNGSTILHLNQTAAEYAYCLVKNLPTEKAVDHITRRYQVSRSQASQDYDTFCQRIQTLIQSTDLDPITFLDYERQRPFSGRLVAPYRLDCAITYQTRQSSTEEIAPLERVTHELTTADWMFIIDKAWANGIPHIIFTGGEPTLRKDLPDLIERAEKNGQIAGVLTDGCSLVEPGYLERLLQTGLDHLMIVFNPSIPESWQGLEKALAADLFVAVHLTLTPGNFEALRQLIDQFSERGVKAISISTSDASLKTEVTRLREKIAERGLELVWNLPVPYSRMHPVNLELAPIASEQTERAWLYVEPDGDVLPQQGQNQVLGNLLRDSWEKIWQP